MYRRLKRVVVRRPDTSFAITDPDLWNYTATPDLQAAQNEHDSLVNQLRRSDVEIIYHDTDLPDHADSIYVFDPILMTNRGAVLLKMGKELRRGEEEGFIPVLENHEIPVLGRLTGNALAEGGDLLWIDDKTLAAGIGFRTNMEGVSQLRTILQPLDVQVIPVELPYFKGARACLHLLSLISIVRHDLAVIYPPLLSVPFWQFLRKRQFRFVEVPESEFATMGPNVLALDPDTCLMLTGNSTTRKQLEKSGVEVLTYSGNEISLKAEGGPTCLTQPVWRAG